MKTRLLALVLVLVMLCTALIGCKPKDPDPQPTPEEPNPLAGTYDITMWVSEKDNVADLFRAQIDKFEAANPGIIINPSIEGVTEADAGSKVVADVASAPDIFCFAQDQLARLVQASALAKLGVSAQATVKELNDAGSVAASTVAGTMYAYPMTSDNGYYMYYDTSIISEEDAKDLAKLVKACEDNNVKFRFALENAWYTASFFFATGCDSQWTMDAEGNFNAVNDDFNSDKGLIAMKGMQILAKSPAYDSDADNFVDAGVIVTGIWNAGSAEEHFGENLGVAELPSFTVDGQSYHLGGYSGFKLMGVKPTNDPKKAAVLSLLAQYLTNEECQLERYEAFQWGPSNKAAQASEAVQSNPSLAALAAQIANPNTKPQGQIHGSWWDIAKVLGADAKNAATEDDLKAALAQYKEAIDALLSMTEEEKQAWGAIGSINGTSWDTDNPMTKVEDGVWESDVIVFTAGQEFKLRRGADWYFQIGVTNDKTGENDTGYYVRMQESDPEPGNIAVEVTGSYKIRLEWDGESHNATVTLVAAE